MEVDQRQCKLQRISNGNGKLILASKISHNPHQMNDEEEGDGKQVTRWGSSRIVRVSRASGGKDRHSKVLTSRGLRDRRVRLAVNTAIQFYDLQDRLGFDQPSKAVEWLLKAAESSIEELPPISTQFPGEAGSENCGSGVCLSRCESRANAMEGGKESEKDLNPDIPQTTSFTELLGVGFNNVYTNQWSSSTMDYSTGGLFRSQVRPIGVGNQEAFSIASDHLIPSDNSSGLNRGTLQSNSSSSLFTPIVGPPPNIFNGPVENHIQFVSGFDAGLQLYYGKVEADQK